MKKFFILLVAFVAVIISCKKENPHAQWDVEAIGPLLNASLTIDKLIADSITQVNADQSVTIVYERSLYNLKLDSIYQIPDTTIPTIFTWPIFGDTIRPGQTFYSNNNNVVLGVSGVQLTQAIIQSGKIRLDVRNTLPSKIIFTYTIPKALKDGSPFQIVQPVDAASGNVAGTFKGDFDFTGYTVDLKGASGTAFNTVAYNVIAKSDPAGQAFRINLGDTLINLKSSMVSIIPSYAVGYLGQSDITEQSTSNIGIGKLIGGGSILLDSVKLNLDIENSVGADARLTFHSFQSINDRDHTTIPLIAPGFLNQPFNINRATDTPPPAAAAGVQSTRLAIQLDKNNSNLKAFLENLPQRFGYYLSLQFNPLANVSGYHDFVYSDRLVNATMRFEMPLRFAASNLMLTDTQDLGFGNFTSLDPIGPSTFTWVGVNGYPFDINLLMLTLDDHHQVTDSLFVPGLIAAAPVDANFRVTGPKETRISLPVDAARKQRILNARYAVIQAKFNTPSYPQLFQIYSGYKLDLRLIADGIYSIR